MPDAPAARRGGSPSAPAGQAPGVLKVRILGAADDAGKLAAYLAGSGLAAGEHIEVLETSAPYPNRREPGARVYLTIRVSRGGRG